MHAIDMGLAFLEGFALIISPCILPVLPLVLAASAEGGRRRPYGIIIGFVLAFSLFAIVARELIVLLGLDPDLIRDASLVLLALFGLVLLSSKLSEKFSLLTQGAANFGNRFAAPKTASGGEGLCSGILIGSLIGLVWTPCAGPILAAVLVQVIRQQSDLAGNLVILSFAVGVGVPMLIIALTGRKIIARLGFLTRHTEALRRAFGVLVLASVALIASGVDTAALFSPSQKIESMMDAQGLQNELVSPYAAPEFAGIEAWQNSPPLTMQGLKGKVVLVDFWTYSCINCVRTLPYLTEWDSKYRDRGLVIVGVHSPEFEFEKDPDNVRAAIAEHGIRYPVALDNRLDTWINFSNRYWPAHYLIDREGQVVYTHFGEGEYRVTENNIRYLLGLRGASETTQAEALPFSPEQTAEAYLGYERAANFSSREAMQRDTPRGYRYPAQLGAGQWALNGSWSIAAEKITSTEKGAGLRLNFKARKVFLVLGTASGKPVRVSLMLNGKAVGSHAGRDAPSGALVVGRNTLYELIDQQTMQDGLLELRADEPGLEAYAFTFGS
jgi:cytochrome c biogenesis protein CcdA/thiol-disulfide isomerase/thioredoxin